MTQIIDHPGPPAPTVSPAWGQPGYSGPGPQQDRRWIVPVIVAVAVILFALTRGGIGSTSSANGDVTIKSCSAGSVLPRMTLKITNRSSKTSDYIILVELLDAAGNRVGEGSAWENNLAPGQSAISDALATTHGRFVKCQVSHVTRLAS